MIDEMWAIKSISPDDCPWQAEGLINRGGHILGRLFGGRRSPRMAFALDGPSRVHIDVFCCVDPSAARLSAREAVRSAFACKPQTDQAARQPLVGGHQAAGPNRLLGVFWFAGCLNMRLGQRKRIIRTNCSSGGFTRPTTQTPLPDPAPSRTTSQHGGFWSRLRP